MSQGEIAGSIPKEVLSKDQITYIKKILTAEINIKPTDRTDDHATHGHQSDP